MHGFRNRTISKREFIHILLQFCPLTWFSPLGSYFMLSMVEIQFRFLQKWFLKALLVFAVMTFSEIMQKFGFYFFGETFDFLDILMFGIGVLIAVLVDKQIFERFLPHWKYDREKR